MSRRRDRNLWVVRRWWVLYLVLLSASYGVEFVRGESASVDGPSLEIPAMRRDGPVDGSTMALGWCEWSGRELGSAVVLIHGSPGRARDFTRLGKALAARGHRVVAFDLPGFGESDPTPPDYSMLAGARAVLAGMDALDIEKAHLVGWSNGGGVVLHAADLEPARAASVTLLASVGDQAMEGSGSYAFEHAKYAVGWVALVAAPRLVPHFGVYPLDAARAFIRNFWESDQRPLRAIMEQLETPALVLHGRRDFLVPAAAAEHHHRLIPESRLVMLDASHFLPLLSVEETVEHLGQFFDDVDAGRPVKGVVDLAPVADREGVAGKMDDMLEGVRICWWVWHCAGVVVLTVLFPRAGVWLTAWVVAAGSVDLGVAAVGVVAGRWIRPWPGKGRSEASRWAWHPLRAAGAMVGLRVLALAASMPHWFFEHGTLGFASGVVVLGVTWWAFPRVWTWEGRQRMKAGLSRIWRHEFWPAKVFYAPLVPWVVVQAARRRTALGFTCVNPGIEAGGGMVGESKYDILRAMTGSEVLHAELIAAGASALERAERTLELVASVPELGGWPVILKPDRAQRGAAVKLARTPEDVRAYFERIRADVLVQRYHPGPHEVGVFWIRDPQAQPEGRQGRIFAITRKEFSYLVGDGKRSLRKLILAHKRYRCQADVFFTRFADRLDKVLPAGEVLRLAEAGNHAQGTLFRDGADLVTPALEEVIDRIAASFRGRDGGGFDFGRFDVRFADEEALIRGEGLGIVELNGTLSEATNLYDPDRSLFWSYGVLFRQWAHLYRLGAWRKAQGVKPMTLLAIWRMIRAYAKEDSNHMVAD
ncbi:MAG: alpha/beta fold hydrolase [Phycisphaeraceae bacterium]|nr:alpha/beta fold hydrolase [Phycisphaeraceae bacterium]